ncbi:MAG TPA: NAD(P)-dependent oxidoreductase [Edaphobacter sp.]
MKILLAGASGAIGQALIPLLLAEHHEVYGAFRNAAHTDRVQRLGATPVVFDALDATAVGKAANEIHPQAIIHQLTAIPARIDLRHFERDFALTNQLRTEGTRNLTTAAVNAGVEKFIAQSFAGWPYARTGIRLKTEEDSLDPSPPPQLKSSLDALQMLENTVSREQKFTGIVLRYGPLYGPNTSISRDGTVVEDIHQHKFPLIGQGTGVWSFLHIHDAATATVAALNHGQRGIYNIVDDDPALVSDWLPYLAECVGAKPPSHIPNMMAKLMVGEHVVALMNDIRGVSNEKAKRELNWAPKWASWRQGFREAL